ncbi:hypothetical protein ASPBRDRAFT_515572 [Aspergillus brasiliensis CBS 101740]|uniref:Uncharacterized protein n=1 Tax=Aspergillus brasiliensis (strain CBS 101740 / IMI 381727 / IBT 21946) TaxID=767769 RepID=A0A1L9UQ29_ASPBC|nr:hypothetical protein ASPBRDRAFT_515572 [Aspergillus brasiliensis CBS 101740]
MDGHSASRLAKVREPSVDNQTPKSARRPERRKRDASGKWPKMRQQINTQPPTIIDHRAVRARAGQK